MKVAVVLSALVSYTLAMSYGAVKDHPVTFDALDDGYPNPEKLVSIQNFGVGIAVPHRETKFSPVRYVHHGNQNGGNPHAGNPHGGNPHAGNPHGVIGGQNQGFGNQFNNFKGGSFNGQGFVHPPSGTGNNVGYANRGKVFTRDPQGFFPAKRGTGFDGQLHRISNPSLPHTGHEINTENIHIGVPLASKPVHSPLKGYQAPHPIKRLPLRKIDLGAHAVDIKSNNKGYNFNFNGGYAQPDILRGSVHKTPLRFPVIPIVKKDSFKGDNFFNGNIGHAPVQTGYGGGNVVSGGNPGVY